MDESQSQAVHLRMEQAHETLKEAETLQDHALWRGVINRSYYAMFYAVLALAALRDVAISKHTHAVAFSDKEFVHKDVLAKELSRSLHYGFDQPSVTMANFGKLNLAKLKWLCRTQNPL
jgi:uncharacterized protein (UPF0332 family)